MSNYKSELGEFSPTTWLFVDCTRLKAMMVYTLKWESLRGEATMTFTRGEGRGGKVHTSISLETNSAIYASEPFQMFLTWTNLGNRKIPESWQTYLKLLEQHITITERNKNSYLYAASDQLPCHYAHCSDWQTNLWIYIYITT